jgi:hypothetical protein
MTYFAHQSNCFQASEISDLPDIKFSIEIESVANEMKYLKIENINKHKDFSVSTTQKWSSIFLLQGKN